MRDVEAALEEAFEQPVVSKSTVSRICAETRERYRAGCDRRLDEHDLVYLFLDTVYLKLRPDDTPAEGVLVAWAVTLEGRKVLLGLQLGSRESYENWLDLGRDLIARGMRPPALLVADGAPGLWKAARELWPSALEQRCTVHALRNATNRGATSASLADMSLQYTSATVNMSASAARWHSWRGRHASAATGARRRATGAPWLARSSTSSATDPKYVVVTATTATADAAAPAPDVELVSVTSSEPDNAPGGGDGNTVDDVVVDGPRSFRLRGGAGRERLRPHVHGHVPGDRRLRERDVRVGAGARADHGPVAAG